MSAFIKGVFAPGDSHFRATLDEVGAEYGMHMSACSRLRSTFPFPSSSPETCLCVFHRLSGANTMQFRGFSLHMLLSHFFIFLICLCMNEFGRFEISLSQTACACMDCIISSCCRVYTDKYWHFCAFLAILDSVATQSGPSASPHVGQVYFAHVSFLRVLCSGLKRLGALKQDKFHECSGGTTTGMYNTIRRWVRLALKMAPCGALRAPSWYHLPHHHARICVCHLLYVSVFGVHVHV